MQKPLAEILRPDNLNDYLGQQHLIGTDAPLRKAMETGILPSMILWGPPGVGKTTLANVIAQSVFRPFYTLSAVNSGVKEVREVIDRARKEQRAILFIDEIHRFSKSQQDSLLAAVEQGVITLIGATTENPSFEVIAPLLSRCQVYVLHELSKNELLSLLQRAKNYVEKHLHKEIDMQETSALLRISGGDARKLLNAFELVISQTDGKVVITDENVTNVVQQNISLYDKNGEMHYDIISAFIKSMRGSDPNGTVYWLARMIHANEDPLFIARRMVIFASEDIGNANPNALLLANACFDAVHKVGYPEGRIVLSQTAVYLACSVKSNATYLAIDDALETVRKTGHLAVPLHLRNAPTKLMKELGYGEDYKYAHNYEHNFVLQEFLPDALQGTTFYRPGKSKHEETVKARLKMLWQDKYDF